MMLSIPVFLRLSWVTLFLVGCNERPDSPPDASAQNAAVRLKLTQALARNIQFYHSSDDDAAQSGWQDGRVYSISNGPGRKYQLYHSRIALRAELNRMLDSLKSTGNLRMGIPREGTDTLLSRASIRSLPSADSDAVPVGTSTTTSTSTTWVASDSAATVRTRTLPAEAKQTP